MRVPGSRLRQFALALVLLIPGTPQVLAQDYAITSLFDFATRFTAQRTTEEDVARYGAPPDATERELLSNPTPSGAHPPYPRNHVFDGELVDVSNPPANHNFSAEPYEVGTPPTNFDLETAPNLVGTPPTNADFETGDLTGWTTSGTVTIQSDAEHGAWAKLSGSGATLISDAFTVDSAAQTFSLEFGWLTSSGYSGVWVYVLSGAGYATQTQIGDVWCSSCEYWETRSFDAQPWSGQSVKLKVVRTYGDVGVDALRLEQLFPSFSMSGYINRWADGSDHYARMWADGAKLTTAAFTVDAATQLGAVQARRTSSGNFYLYLYVLSGVDFATVTEVFRGPVTSTNWKTISFSLTGWLGQSVKVRVQQLGVTGGHIDDLGAQRVELPGWSVGSTASIARVAQDGGHVLHLGDGSVTSAAFTLDAQAQQLTVRYRSSTSTGQAYVDLLYGENFSEVYPLSVSPVFNPDTINWHIFTAGVSEFAGQPVKLRLTQALGGVYFDDIGYAVSLLPDWEVYGNAPAIAIGEDEHGSYVTSEDETGNGYNPSFQQLGTMSTGIIDRQVQADLRYYAVAYDIGQQGGSIIKVWWTNAVTGQDWAVFMDASNTPTGYKVGYFYLADFMGTEGHFSVNLSSEAKLYSIADNIARQQLSEPYSEQVGYGLDTSTGSFGHQETDITTQALLPLSFTRYYAGHSDHFGLMGYRWSHTYDIRLFVTEDADAGVIYGSGREVFFDWVSGTFNPADARVHDTLVKNPGGSYTYTATTNLSYHFSAAGVLQTISDLNGN